MKRGSINDRRLRFVLNDRGGEVGRDLTDLAARAERIAKRLIREEGLVRSGAFHDRTVGRVVRDGRGQVVTLGSNVRHFRYLEFGTKPHVIRPKRQSARSSRTRPPALWWEHGAERGWFVPTRPLPKVNHPGNKAYRIMRRAMQLAAKGVTA